MYNRIQNFLLNLPPIFRNIFFLTTIAFAVWMLFLDENNMINQYRKRSELIDLEKKRDYSKMKFLKLKKNLNYSPPMLLLRKNLHEKTIG